MVDQKKSKTEKTEQSKKENIIQTTDDKKGKQILRGTSSEAKNE